jgi:hypothetical protein
MASVSTVVAALVIVAIGPLGAGFVDTDPLTTPRVAMSWGSNVHAALGALFILGFPVAATVAGISAASDPAVGRVLGSHSPGSSGRASATRDRTLGVRRTAASAGPTA